MRLLLVLAAASLLVGCGGQAGGAHDTSLHGTVTRGPITPVCMRGQSCSKPAAGVTLRFSNGSAVVAGVQTGGDGSYRINLPAGRYSVAGPKGLRPTRVSLPGDGSRRLNFLIDTGIR